MPPVGGTRHLARLLRALVATPSASRRTALAAGLGATRPRSRRRPWSSSWATSSPPSPMALAARRPPARGRRESGSSSPARRPLPDAGLVALEDAEAGRRRVVDAGRGGSATPTPRRRSAAGRDFRRWCARRRASPGSTSRRPTTRSPLAPFLPRPGRAAGARRDRRGEPAARRPACPPRPNLGPEPWPGRADRGRAVALLGPGPGARSRSRPAGSGDGGAAEAPGRPPRPRRPSRPTTGSA